MVHDEHHNLEGRGLAHVLFVPGDRLHDLSDPTIWRALA
jgi:hypothetical protein